MGLQQSTTRFTITGTIKLANVKPAPGVSVTAFNKGLRSQSELGTAVTERDGSFNISYAAEFPRQEYKTADVFFQLATREGKNITGFHLYKKIRSRRVLVEKPQVIFNAGSKEAVEIELTAEEAYKGISEFEEIAAAIRPLLEVPLEQLTENEKNRDISFIAGETGMESELVSRFVVAHRFGAQSRIEPEFWYGLFSGKLYADMIAALRTDDIDQRVKIIFSTLDSISSAQARRIIHQAIDANKINSPKERTEDWIKRFISYVSQNLASPAEGGPKVFVTQVLHASGLSADKRGIFLQAYQEHEGPVNELWKKLRKDKTISEKDITLLETSFRLSDLVMNNFTAAKAVREELKIEDTEKLKAAAKLSVKDWEQFIIRQQRAGTISIPEMIVGNNPAAKVQAYARIINKNFKEAFPTNAFLGELERALQDRDKPSIPGAEQLKRFIDQHPDFELLSTSIDSIFERDLTPGNAAVNRDAGLRQQLKSVQRVFKLAPDYAATNTLLKDDLHSAAQIYRQGKNSFVKKYESRPGFTKQYAKDVYNKAANTHAAVVTLVGELKALESGGAFKALPDNAEAVNVFPNWQTLFGKADICECEHCRSVYSPGAYFADLLMFLKNRTWGIPAPFNNTKNVFFDRRPDLGYLELSCENANTPLPYIDVVNEVLETVVAAGEDDIELAGLTAIPANQAQARTAVTNAFTNAGIELATDFMLSPIAGTNQFMIRDTAITYLLKKKATPNYFYEITRQTKVPADELRAYPQYVKPAAYEKLSTAVYPWVLPFSLFNEEVRLFLEKAGTKQWQLMKAFLGNAIPNDPSGVEIAAAYFNITYQQGAPGPNEGSVMLTPDAGSQFRYWGEANNAALLNKLKKVNVFLQRTGLEYNDMLILLDLAFVNPNGSMQIQHLDSSCDTDKKEITNLNAAAFDRMHRFIKLWRKLGWAAWEVDIVVMHEKIGNGSINEAFLVNLMYFVEVKNALGKVSVEELCSLFGNINTKTKFSKLHEIRTDSLYHKLFQNKKLSGTLDEAFELSKVDVISSAELISAHYPVVMGGIKIKEKDLLVLAALTKPSDDSLYNNDQLTLKNLSFLYRNALLSKLLRFKMDEWSALLKLLNTDRELFSSTKEAYEAIEKIKLVKAGGFSLDEVNYILSCDLTAKAAIKEKDLTKALIELRKGLKDIIAEYDKSGEKYSFLQTAPPTDIDTTILEDLLKTLLQQLNFTEDSSDKIQNIFRGEIISERTVGALPDNFAPLTVTGINGFSYDATNKILRFTGIMTTAQRATLLTDASLAAVTGNAAYQSAVEELFEAPRILIKFFEHEFTAPLETLPETIDFKKQLDASLANKVYYEAEVRILHFTGIMTVAERTALTALSADALYVAAINSLFDQPRSNAADWLAETDLAFPLRDLLNPVNDNQNANLVTAINKILDHLKTTLSNDLVIQQFAGLTALRPATIALLFKAQLFPPQTTTVLDEFTGAFAATSSTIDPLDAAYARVYQSGYWSHRVALLINKLKLDLEQVEWLKAMHSKIGGLNVEQLPLTPSKPQFTGEFINTVEIFRLHGLLSIPELSFLEILTKLDAGGYPNTDLAADLYLLTEWGVTDIATITTVLNLAYPADYLSATTWKRILLIFSILEKLGGAADTVKDFANAALTMTEANALKQLLMAKYDEEAWLQLSTEVQDVLRERKRNGLVAYLLTQPMPANVPSGKWETQTDLYSHYLIDVEMASCQLTSRLVQGSGSIQLFVQRAFMGLEPNVKVDDTMDSAWKWWKWMKKYRVWEANRKVFLYPENWIEPELRIDKSPFFAELENALLQDDVNTDTVETAFLNYLAQVDSVSRLEIAGSYHEDDGDKTIMHVFARTFSTEPHIHYYRQWDYRRWSPWEKVDLDISEDYLVPTMINKRLYIFWPVFTEVSADDENKVVDVPDIAASNQPIPQVRKKLKVQLAMSEFRNNKWSAKKVSVDRILSDSYESALRKENFRFMAVDKTACEGKFIIYFTGTNFATYTNGSSRSVDGAFEFGCKGIPEKSFDEEITFHRVVGVRDSKPYYQKEQEDFPMGNDFTFVLSGKYVGSEYLPVTNGYTSIVLNETPGLDFKVSLALQLSYFDKFFQEVCKNQSIEKFAPFGLWLPFFFEDKNRSFFVLPVLAPYNRKNPVNWRWYYPELKMFFMAWENYFNSIIEMFLDSMRTTLPLLTAAERNVIETFLANYFNATPPFTNDEIIEYHRIIFKQYVNFLLGLKAMEMQQFIRYHFKNFYHPYTCFFARQVYIKGIDGLMKRETQLKDTGFDFAKVYQPTINVLDPMANPPGVFKFYPRENVDFTPDGSYSQYNWELFYHAPLMIAMRLSRNQRFEEAMDWFHYIFNPLDSSGNPAPQKFWVTKPFFQKTQQEYVQQRIENIMKMLAGDTAVDGYTNDLKDELEDQVLDWRDNPFDPHIIAQFRTIAYQKTTILKYLDNLIAWGDQLFRQDSMESINEATQLYILAAELLGPKPKKVPPRIKPPVECFNELEAGFDSFSNALVDVENLIPPLPPGNDDDDGDKAPIPDMLYFCIPLNDKLLEYWDIVADRLYKIRHCMNIEGVERQLALFEPPIDPGMLVKAAAAGLDLSSVLADLNSPMPFYRFGTMLQKSLELCGELKGLGNALLMALEKKDAEALGLLRQSQEIKLLEAVKSVKQMQRGETLENLEALNRTKVVIEAKRDYYRSLEKIIEGEQMALDMQKKAHEHQTKAQNINVGASMLGYLPNMTIGGSGFGGSPHLNAQWGTGNIISAMQASAGAETNLANSATYQATKAATLAGYDRRQMDWDFQASTADKEILQIEKQIAAATIRVAIAEKEIENHDLQMENSKAVNDFMEDKYTNKQLYEWTITQVSQVYFQSYKLAYDLAKKAERCYRHELGLDDSSFIQFGYWDSMKKGLLAGEKLALDLKRMDAAYLDINKREYELTKHVSLAQFNPDALFVLKKTGKAMVILPEALYDLDYPGHYMRRIKNVSITIPCVAGPYTTVSCALRLIRSSVRKKNTLLGGVYARDPDESAENRFRDTYGAIQSIATSHGQNDSGMFELNFKDERYLPFEGAGVISEWQVEFPSGFRQFDFESISDVIFHVKYTAREGGKALGDKAQEEMIDKLNNLFMDEKGLFRAFSLRHDFPDAWHQLINTGLNPQQTQFEIKKNFFPYMFAGRTLEMTELKVYLQPKPEQVINTGGLDLLINEELPAGAWSDFKQTNIKQATYEFTDDPVMLWSMDAGNNGLKKEEIDDVLLVMRYVLVP